MDIDIDDELRARMLDEAIHMLRSAFAERQVVVKGYPSIGSLSFDHLPEAAVKLFMALS